ncbi:MAG: hypothetical protein ABI743_06060 [bacterium]
MPPECEDFETLRNAQLSYVGDDHTLLINGREAWEYYWNQAYPNEPPAPEINFETRSVLAIGLGPITESGHSLSIECVHRSGDRLTISYTHHHPGENCAEPGAFQPVLIVVINKYVGEVTWTQSNVTEPACDPPPPPECSDFTVLTDASQPFGQLFETRVIRSQGGLAEYYGARYPGKPVPTLNFDQVTVLAIVIGSPDVPGRPNIDCVHQPLDGPATVTWHKVLVNNECPFEDANWSEVIAVPRFDREFDFFRTEDRLDICH